MSQSDSIKELTIALCKAQAAFPVIARTKTVQVSMKSGGKYTFTYTPLEKLIEFTRHALNKEGLAVTQWMDGHNLITKLTHSSGEWMSGSMEIKEPHVSPQDFGSLLTYYRRYSYALALGVASEEDDDASPRWQETGASSGRDLCKLAFEQSEPEDQEFLKRTAADVRALLEEKREAEAHALLEHQHLDQEQKLAIWYLFGSKERAALKSAQSQADTVARAEKQNQRGPRAP